MFGTVCVCVCVCVCVRQRTHSLFALICPVKREWVAARSIHPNLWRLVCAYRDHGHKMADLDPLRLGDK